MIRWALSSRKGSHREVFLTLLQLKASMRTKKAFEMFSEPPIGHLPFVPLFCTRDLALSRFPVQDLPLQSWTPYGLFWLRSKVR